jgi:hypothetical protein
MRRLKLLSEDLFHGGSSSIEPSLVTLLSASYRQAPLSRPNERSQFLSKSNPRYSRGTVVPQKNTVPQLMGFLTKYDFFITYDGYGPRKT